MNVTYEALKDCRGDLTPIEFSGVPFIPKRVFVVKNVPKNVTRGGHAHFETMQVVICIQGEIEVVLDDGTSKRREVLTEGQSCFIDSLVWDEQVFLTGNDILLVLCSTSYDKEDYITDYLTFQTILKCL
jgi:dTDP-4-dehydrorhamnose 3,5-epimerase-like enzyme